jgi:plastocyanin
VYAWMRLSRLSAVAVLPLMLGLASMPASATAAAPLVIGVDAFDPANQVDFGPGGPPGRIFEYTDFFSRQVTVHSGDTIDLRSAPGSFHVVALARTENWARTTYPVAFADNDGGGAADIAAGSGTNKLGFGLSNFPLIGSHRNHDGPPIVDFTRGFGPPVCGVAAIGEPACSFTGGDQIQVLGPEVGVDWFTLFTTGNFVPTFVDQLVTINTQPGRYHYFCYIHPGMRGQLDVVGQGAKTSTQAEIDAASATQFAADQAAGVAAEGGLVAPIFTGSPGARTYTVHMGINAADNHVAIDEVFPTTPLQLAVGDRVQYLWADPHNFHSVTFPAWSRLEPAPFGFDCAPNVPGYVGVGAGPVTPCFEPGDTTFEVIGDPGNAGPGSSLSNPGALLDAGVLGGTGYDVSPSAQSWWIQADGQSAKGVYHFQCTIHDWMQGSLVVG